MPITVICPKCQQRFDVPDSYAGREGACTRCQAPLRVPPPGAPAAAPAPAPMAPPQPAGLAPLGAPGTPAPMPSAPAPMPAAPMPAAPAPMPAAPAPMPAAPAPMPAASQPAAPQLGAPQLGAPQPAPMPARLTAPPASEAQTEKVTIGREIGAYSLQRKLGAATSSVFLASSPQGPVAIKLLPSEIAARSPTVGKRFLREARTLFSKQHPNLVRTVDAGEELGTFFLVMEFVEGQDLEQLMQARGGMLPEAEVLPIALQVARGLVYLREQGLLHRNLKPEHVLIDAQRNVKLAGLGLIRAEEAEGQPVVTVKGAVVGTPAYMSPEQARADELDIRSDLYTLGITLYHLLTGELPFQAKVVAQILRQLTQEPCPDVRDKAPETSKGLAAVIARLVEKKPTDRYATPQDLVTDLEALSKGELVDGLPPIAGMAAGTAAGSAKVRATQVAALDADAKVKQMKLIVIGLVVVVLGLVVAIVVLMNS